MKKHLLWPLIALVAATIASLIIIPKLRTKSHAPTSPAKPDFTKLPPYQPRTFVPDNTDLTDPNQLAALYQKLLDRQINSAPQLENLLLDRSELHAALSQQRSILYIKMTCQTDDPHAAQAYKNFTKTVPPVTRPLDDNLDRKYLELRTRFQLDKDRYHVYDRDIRTSVELFRPENIPLQTNVRLLSQQYQTICGATTVKFRDSEYTIPQMSKFLQQTDRPLRQAAWKTVTDRRLQDRDKFDEIFDKMLNLRRQIAANAGFNDYCQYIFRARHRYDYTSKDCKRYQDAVESLVVPLLEDIYNQRKNKMNLTSLRPWDMAVDPQGLPPLKPFDDVNDLISGTQKMLARTDPQLGSQFQKLIDLNLLDLASRKGKAPGGYQSTLSEARLPFIFANAVGIDGDLRTLLHEAGHAFHTFAAVNEPLIAYRHAPLEFCELASMAMELFAAEHLSVFYGPNDLRRCRREHLENIIQLLAWIATVDAFQHWLYENPDHNHQQRNDAWVKIHNRFGGSLLDWSGLENQHACLWQKQRHIFLSPFYYIEYAIAQLGALQLWTHAKSDPAQTLTNYRNALALGGSKPLPQLFQTAGLNFDFSEKTIAPAIKTINAELAKN